jgi:hypothetical protein
MLPLDFFFFFLLVAAAEADVRFELDLNDIIILYDELV